MAVPKQKDDNQSIPYFIIKCTIGFFYYRWLHAANLTSPKVRWLTFQIISPIIKLYHLNYHTNNNSINNKKKKALFLFSIIHDLITSSLYYFIIIHLKGIWYSFGALPLIFPPMALLEYILGCKMLQLTTTTTATTTSNDDDDDDVYVLKKPTHWTDPVATFGLGMGMFTLLGMTTTTTTTTTTATAAATPLHHDFIAFICLLLYTDLQFGITHYISHRLPNLWTKHKIHHEYGRGTLNAYSNLHGEALDNIQMNGVLLLPILVTMTIYHHHNNNDPQNPPIITTMPFTEWLYLIPFTHMKFQMVLINLMSFYEWDLLDMVLRMNRLGSYHTIHHEMVGRNFSIFGIWTDKVCKSVGLFLIGDDRNKEVDSR
jgi:sterol desaturase/sphingolipid hydroxylase (fatty acid hydroxylase superfamily)